MHIELIDIMLDDVVILFVDHVFGHSENSQGNVTAEYAHEVANSIQYIGAIARISSSKCIKIWIGKNKRL